MLLNSLKLLAKARHIQPRCTFGTAPKEDETLKTIYPWTMSAMFAEGSSQRSICSAAISADTGKDKSLNSIWRKTKLQSLTCASVKSATRKRTGRSLTICCVTLESATNTCNGAWILCPTETRPMLSRNQILPRDNRSNLLIWLRHRAARSHHRTRIALTGTSTCTSVRRPNAGTGSTEAGPTPSSMPASSTAAAPSSGVTTATAASRPRNCWPQSHVRSVARHWLANTICSCTCTSFTSSGDKRRWMKRFAR